MTQKKPEGDPLLIMLVEDNVDHADLVKLSFKKHRVANKIIHVTEGEEALDYLSHRGAFVDSEEHPLPSLILLDLRLPKIDGLEVLGEIKKADNLRQIPVVILTSSEAEKDVAKAYEHHANSYLVKPLDFNKFSTLMDDLGFYWLAWNCPAPAQREN
ncbi:MAG: response regulator [Candidatus Heimdallarchaeota archaeon]